MSLEDMARKLGAFDGATLADNAHAPDFIIADVMETDCIGMLGGGSGAYKSFIALEMAHCIATGRDFMGFKVVRQGVVLFVAGEGAGGLQRRIKALELRHGKAENLICIPRGEPITGDYARMIQAYVGKLQPVLIVYDTFNQLMVEIDNNNSSDVSRALNTIKTIGRASGIGTTSLVNHHIGKDAGRGLEGSHAFKSNSDFVFTAERPEDSKTTTLKCTKQKDGAPFREFNMTADEVRLGFKDQLGRECMSFVLYQASLCLHQRARSNEQPGFTAKDETLRAVRALYQEQKRTLGDENEDPIVLARDIEKWMKCNSQKAFNRKWLAQLVEDKKLRRNGDGYGPF
jgi:hypothetical protein